MTSSPCLKAEYATLHAEYAEAECGIPAATLVDVARRIGPGGHPGLPRTTARAGERTSRRLAGGPHALFPERACRARWGPKAAPVPRLEQVPPAVFDQPPPKMSGMSCIFPRISCSGMTR